MAGPRVSVDVRKLKPIGNNRETALYAFLTGPMVSYHAIACSGSVQVKQDSSFSARAQYEGK